MGIMAIAIRHLISAGVTGDALVMAIAEMESAIEPIDNRSTGAKRQDRFRRNKALQNVTSVTSNALPLDGFCSPTPPLTSFSPIKENPPIGGQKKVSQSRGARLQENWRLPDEWGEWAETHGMRQADILLEQDKFRDYWTALPGGKASKKNWEATWRNWIRNHLERKQVNGIRR